MTTAKALERLVWVVEQLRVEPADKILEIGCGYGVAVSLVCEKLSNGRIAAIDRSPTMIAMAAKRNAAHVAAGRASFSTAALHEAEFGNDLFDKVFAIHVGLFLPSDPARDLAIIHRLLAPGGALYLAYEPFAPRAAKAVAATLSAVLAKNNFVVSERLVADLSATRIACVVATSGRSI